MTSLRALARDVTLTEGLRSELSIAQVAEVLAVLGIRWRDLCRRGEGEAVFAEMHAILSRAGVRSAHLRVVGEGGADALA